MSKEWPETIEEMANTVEEIIAKFPGWDTFEWEDSDKGKTLYDQSVDLAVEANLVAFNYIAQRLGLSAYQASLVPGMMHGRAFKGL